MKYLTWILCLLAAQWVTAQEPQIVVPCKVVDVYDGDTVTVRVTLDVRVRLLDCWSPEVKTKDATEKAYGIHARETLREMIDGRDATLIVPLNGERLDDVFTFGRLLARLRVGGLDVSEEMVRMGVADEVKR